MINRPGDARLTLHGWFGEPRRASLAPRAYDYDDANRLVSVTDWDLNETTFAYDDAGRMTTVTFPSSVDIESTYTYDAANRLTGIEHVKGGTTTVAFVEYDLDDVGNRIERRDDEGTHVYCYDDLYRLTSVTYPGPSTTTYQFDAFGNREEMTTGAGTTTYAYDDADRITSVTPPGQSPVTWTWDDNGNLTERGSDSFEWDYQATALETYYYLADGLGSTMLTVDSDGDDVNAYTYDVYGEPRTTTGAHDNEYQFTGQQVDGDTGLQYLRARYYDMEAGVFLAREPLAAVPGWRGNPHQYVGGNPTRWVDPTGLLLADVLGGMVGAGPEAPQPVPTALPGGPPASQTTPVAVVAPQPCDAIPQEVGPCPTPSAGGGFWDGFWDSLLRFYNLTQEYKAKGVVWIIKTQDPYTHNALKSCAEDEECRALVDAITFESYEGRLSIPAALAKYGWRVSLLGFITVQVWDSYRREFQP